MNWKIWVILIVSAFFSGVFIRGHHESVKAAAAQVQIQKLAEQVKNQEQIKQEQANAAVSAQQQAAASDVKAQALVVKWNNRPKPLPPPPINVDNPVAQTEAATANDDLANQTIQALTQDVADQKATILKLTLEVATDNAIIDNQAKEINLGKIALDAQVAANNSSRWAGRFQGAGMTIGVTGVIAVGHHFKLF
jgi:hypothetical protein